MDKITSTYSKLMHVMKSIGFGGYGNIIRSRLVMLVPLLRPRALETCGLRG